jgi:hypothetical protein
MPKDSRIMRDKRFDAMNGEFWAPGKPIFKKWGSVTLDHIIPRYSCDSDGKNNKNNSNNTNQQHLFLETKKCKNQE